MLHVITLLFALFIMLCIKIPVMLLGMAIDSVRLIYIKISMFIKCKINDYRRK